MSGVSLGAALLETRSNTSCHKDEAPDNSILRPIAFDSKSLVIMDKRNSNIERTALGILYGLHHCFVREVSIITDHKPLVAIFKKRCGNIITKTTMKSTENTSIQSENHIPALTRSVHSRLDIQTKSQ